LWGIRLGGAIPNLPAWDVLVDHVGSTTYVYVGNDAGVYRGQQVGATWNWERYGRNFPNVAVFDLEMRDYGAASPKYLAAGTFGRGVWGIDLNAMPAEGGGGALSISDVGLAEGNTGTAAFTFTVTLSQSSSDTVTVNYATLDGTAKTADGDYVAASGMLTFDPGQTSKTITVSVSGDTYAEADERFFVKLSNPTHATID